MTQYPLIVEIAQYDKSLDILTKQTNHLENLPDTEKILPIVNQFEEVFKVCANQEEWQRFIKLLTQAVEIHDSRLAVVITMRADFVKPCLDYPSLTHLIQTEAVFLPPLNEVSLKETITEPAKLPGHSFEEGLLLKILQDVQEKPGFLPLLEFALTKLWQKRPQDKHQLTLEQYEKLGGLTGALNLHAENVYHYQDYQEESPTQERTQQEKEWIKQIFLRLVRTQEGEKDIPQQQPKATLLNLAGDDSKQQQRLSELLDGEMGLIKGRLLVSYQDEQGETWINLAHEALIENWQQFAQWRQQVLDLRQLSDSLEDTRREWLHESADDKYSIQGELLATMTDNLENRQSLTLAEPLRGHEGNVNSVGISPDGQTIVSGGSDNTVRLWNLQGLPLAEPFRGHQGWVYSVAIAGQTIVSGGTDGKVRLWNHQGLPLAEPLQGHEGWVYSVAFSPDGQTIVSGGSDGTIRLWNLQGLPLAEPFRGHDGDVWSLAFSPDGQMIVSGGSDGTIRLWNLQGLSLAEPLRGHQGWVYSVAIAGQTIVSGGTDGTVRLWNLQGLPLVEPLRGHQGWVYSVAISADGQTIVSGGDDGTVRLWNLQGLPLGEALRGHEGWVYSVAISADGQTIVSGGEDGNVRLWRGDWRAWLEVSCDRLDSHPMFTNL